MATNEERAWAAGFFDGEGSVARTVAKNGRVGVPAISITQAGPPDSPPDTLVRWSEAVGVKVRIYGPIFITGRKPRYQLQVGAYADVIKVRDAMWPWLSTDKREAFTSRIEEYEVKRATPLPRSKPQTHCRNGHALVEGNLYVSGKSRRCRTCQLKQSRDARAQRSEDKQPHRRSR